MCLYVFISLWYIPRSRIAGPHANTLFNILRNCQSVFQRSCTILHSHKQCTKVPTSPCPCQHLLFFNCLITANLLKLLKEYLTVNLICISLITNEAEYLFMCLLAICFNVSPMEKCLLMSSIHF